jgi:hypothetical protein
MLVLRIVFHIYLFQELLQAFLLTRRVQAEQEKSDEFLYHMLPRNVARQLRAGNSAIAEQFDNVSLLYSGISLLTLLLLTTYLNHSSIHVCFA